MEVTTGSWRCILGESPRACTNSRFPPAQLTKQTNKLACWHAFWKCQFLSGHWCVACSIICFVFKKKKKDGYSSVSYLYVMFSCCRGSSFSHIRATLFGSSSTWRSKQFSAQSGKALHWSCGGIQIYSTPLGLSKNMTNVNPTSSVS